MQTAETETKALTKPAVSPHAAVGQLQPFQQAAALLSGGNDYHPAVLQI
jgi:hypothetical protein